METMHIGLHKITAISRRRPLQLSTRENRLGPLISYDLWIHGTSRKHRVLILTDQGPSFIVLTPA